MICNGCKLELDNEMFYTWEYKYKDKVEIKYRSKCKKCYNAYGDENKKRKYHIDYAKKYRKDNRDKVNEYQRIYKSDYRDKYGDEVREKQRNYINNRRKVDICFRLSGIISASIRSGLMSKNFIPKTRRTEDILGCSYEYLKFYIEDKFEDWMSWDNYGLYNGELNYGWDIDHIIPLSSAKTKEEMLKLNHYKNLQPLCSKVNRDIKKGRTD